MVNSPETGHAKNVSNFESLLSFVKGYGDAYNPTRDAIKMQHLKKFYPIRKSL